MSVCVCCVCVCVCVVSVSVCVLCVCVCLCLCLCVRSYIILFTQWGYRVMFTVDNREILNENGIPPELRSLATVATPPEGDFPSKYDKSNLPLI